MPPKIKFTKEEIINAAVSLVREEGADALTARNVAARLGSSPKPIFGTFSGMADVRDAVINFAKELYDSYIRNDMESGKFPPYKASGMAYVRFAREETELFKLLFMRSRIGESIDDGREELRPLLDLIKSNTGLDEERAYLLHLEMWIYIHGIATMLASSYLAWEEDFISRTLSHVYAGVRDRLLIEKRAESDGSN